MLICFYTRYIAIQSQSDYILISTQPCKRALIHSEQMTISRCSLNKTTRRMSAELYNRVLIHTRTRSISIYSPNKTAIHIHDKQYTLLCSLISPVISHTAIQSQQDYTPISDKFCDYTRIRSNIYAIHYEVLTRLHLYIALPLPLFYAYILCICIIQIK